MIHETQIILCKHKKYESNPPHETKIPWVRYQCGQTIDDTCTRKHLLELDHLGGGLRGLFLLVQTFADRFWIALGIQPARKRKKMIGGK
jgi:hypothetical protein